MRRTVLAIVFLAFACDITTPGVGTAARPSVPPQPPVPPNILLIVADDVGVAGIGAYQTDVPGALPPPTPNLDALAAGGVRFTQVWSNPVCSPTRATLYTGRYSFRTGVGDAIGVGIAGVPDLATSETTIAEVLSAGGYESALVGKWHLGTSAAVGGNDAPRTAGWDYHAGALGAAISSYTNWIRYENGVGAVSTTYATTQNVDDALAWISTRTGSWMMTVAFNAAHSPYHRPPSSLITSDLSSVVCTSGNDARRTCYKAAIEAMDTEIGRLFAGIDLTTTMVVFVGDNGTPGEVVDPGFNATKAKGSLYQGGVRVPLLISGPQVQNGGRTVEDLVNTADVFVTLAEMAGLTATTGDDSKSLMPYVQDTPTTARSYVYAERFRSDDQMAAMRDTRYKIIQSQGKLSHCYDLTTDPNETINLIRPIPSRCNDLHKIMQALQMGSDESLP